MHIWQRTGIVIVWGLGLALAAQTAGITGKVLDSAGDAVPGARVVITDTTAGTTSTVSSDSRGQFQTAAAAGHQYRVEVDQAGFQPFTAILTAGREATAITAELQLKTAVQSVMVRAGAVDGATVAPTPVQVFQATQTIRVLDREQINALSPVSGSAQILSIAPGVNATSYGNTGATKSTITLNGIQQGWGGYGGYTTAGDAGITFDSIPVADAATGLWQSNMFPQSALINSTGVTYGPGDPDTRWYNNVGGAVEFTPLQPTHKMHYGLSQTFGSYGQENTDFDFTTGIYQGWSAVFAGGHGSGDNFRSSPDGFNNPNHDYAFYGKVIKDFAAGDFSLGYYYSDSEGYRPQVIPTTTVAGVTFDATPGGSSYSQAACGFYCTVPFADYHKYDANRLALLWSHWNVALDPTTELDNSLWFERINRLHNREADVFVPASQQYEYNNPYTKTYGDRLMVAKTLPWNTVDVGGYYLHSLYNAHNNFTDTLAFAGGASDRYVDVGAKIRSSYFNQDQWAGFVQDRVRPFSWLSITPGMRYFNNEVGYSSRIQQDFSFGPGVIVPTHCYLNGVATSTPGNITVQSSSCPSSVHVGAAEPSLNLGIQLRPWLNLYGGYSEEHRAPALGGGGGMFQAVDPSSYQLALAEYSQAGIKVHFDRVGSFANVLAGAAYYHLLFKDQELDIGLGNGDSLYATANSWYDGVNWFADADPTSNIHFFANGNVERATYSNWNQGGTDYSGLPVPYVPKAVGNAGAYYTWSVSENVVVQPRVWFQYTAAQTMFNNMAGVPSTEAMPSFGTLNLAANIPIRFFNLRLTAMNVTDKQYNQFVWISAGGYLGGAPGYLLAYPGSPRTAYATLSVHW